MPNDTNYLTTAYIYDSSLRAKANEAGCNYWYEYIKEINDQLGLTAEEVPLQILADISELEKLNVVIIGDIKASELPDHAAQNLDGWLKDGGVLIGFATEGMEEIFGNVCDGVISQPTDDFTIAGYFELVPDDITTDVHSYLHPSQKLLILSDIRKLRRISSTQIARLYDMDDNETGYAAITGRTHGAGYAYYFAFNVPKTIWLLHQGRPIDADYDGDGYFRSSDAKVIGDNEPEVLYADEILFLLQNMIGRRPQPFIHQIPPIRDQQTGDMKIPEALFYWGGDDEAVAGAQLRASNWMKEKGLPYHVNVMPRDGEFALTVEEAEAIEANGHEYSLHYNFVDGYEHPLRFTSADVQAQANLFYKKFGRRQVCSVLHWTLWTGWEEPAEWMLAAGGKADNSRIHRGSPPLNPVNMLGFSFGTSFPFYIYDDYQGGNAKIDFLIEPITAYEVGHLDDKTDFELVHKVIDITAKYQLTMDMFYHSCNIARIPTCRQAIEEALRYIEERGIIAKHLGNDELWRWWSERTKSTITQVKIGELEISFMTECNYPDGMIVKIPLGNRSIASAKRDGSEAVFQTKAEFGQNWGYVAVERGRHDITLILQTT